MSFFKYFAIAIAKPKQYHKFMKVSLKKGFLYLLLIVLISSIPYIIYSTKNSEKIYNKLEKISVILKEDIPDFEMTKDSLTIKEDVSIDKDIDGIRVIVDKDKDLSVKEIANMGSAIIIDKSKIALVANGAGSISSVPNEDLKDKKLTKADLEKQVDEQFIPIQKKASKITAISFVSTVLANYIIFLVVTAILAGVSIFTTKNLFFKMAYKDLFRISLFAMTVPVIVNLFLMFIPSMREMGVILVLLPGMIYMWIGLKAIKENGYVEEIPYKEEPKRVKPKL